jgi:hypothetical protein
MPQLSVSAKRFDLHEDLKLRANFSDNPDCRASLKIVWRQS